jgi:hypothetical protein
MDSCFIFVVDVMEHLQKFCMLKRHDPTGQAPGDDLLEGLSGVGPLIAAASQINLFLKARIVASSRLWTPSLVRMFWM